MKKIIIVFVSLIILLVGGLFLFYNMSLKAVSSNSSEVEFEVPEGSTYYSIIPKLKNAGLIRNELCFKIYVKLNKISSIEHGTYKLNKNMSVSEIIKVFNKGNNYNPNEKPLTFKEGRNMRYVAKTIADNTSNTEEDVYNLLSDKVYLNELINNYWFIDDSILNGDLYYSLEGYLYPETYSFELEKVTVKEIFKAMLDQTGKKLELYKADLENNKYSIHQILTLASIVELEGKKVEDRKNVAGVFYNRLNSGMNLGSDVTTYYAARVDMSERDLYKTEVESVNAYNTRSSSMAGKLPVGPICNPSIESIEAALKPEINDYYYFVADKNGKTYFTRTNSEHNRKIAELKQAGLWYTY